MLRTTQWVFAAVSKVPEPTPATTSTAPTGTLPPALPGVGRLAQSVQPSPTSTGDSTASTPNPIADVADNVSELAHEGPRAVLDAIAGALTGTMSNVAWVVALVIVAVLVRFTAAQLVNRLTAQLAGPVRPRRWHALVTRNRHSRPRQDVNGLPVVGASFTGLVERRRQRARAIGSLMNSLISSALVVAVMMFIAVRIGVPGGALASAGLLGLGLAVLTQGLARDVLSGLWLLVEDAYGVGDYVDAGFGASGVVEVIGLRTTKLRATDGTIWRVRHAELPRLGNRTQEQTLLMLDVTVGFPHVGPLAPGFADGGSRLVLTATDLSAAEGLVRKSLDRLDRDLLAARRAAFGSPPPAGLPSTVAALVPDLVPAASQGALSDLAGVQSPALDDTVPMDGLAKMLEGLLEDVDIPVLRDTAVVGLTNADAASLTLRVRGTVADTSREQALSVLRRRLFLDLSAEELSVSFAAVNPSEL